MEDEDKHATQSKVGRTTALLLYICILGAAFLLLLSVDCNIFSEAFSLFITRYLRIYSVLPSDVSADTFFLSVLLKTIIS